MALRDQPYLPLYVQDFMTDEKLMRCSAAATGVYIRLMCLMHKPERYGTFTIKKKDRKSEDNLCDFSSNLTRFLPYSYSEVYDGLSELLEEGVIYIDHYSICQKRMIKDAKKSENKAKAGKLGMKSRYKNDDSFCYNKTDNKIDNKGITNPEYENEYENDIDKSNKTVEVDIYTGYDFSENLKSVIGDWIEYKNERRESYKSKGLRGLLSQIRNRLKTDLTEEQIIFGIREGMASNYKGILWESAKKFKRNSPVKTFEEHSKPYKVAAFIAKRILEEHSEYILLQPDKMENTLQIWASDVNELIEKDKANIDELNKVVGFSQIDEFWKARIDSGSSLRKNYAKISRAMSEKNDE